MPTTILNLKTNYNGKMACRRFLHIDLAPARRITETEMNEKQFLVKTDDGSHQPITVRMIDLSRLRVHDLNNTYTSLSHGMDKEEYLQHLKANRKNITPDTELGIYFYEQISD